MRTDIEMEEISCPFCESPGGDPLHREGSFQMVRCPSCQFIYLNPRPTEEFLLQFYQHYLPEEGPSIESWHEMMRSIFQQSARLIDHCLGNRWIGGNKTVATCCKERERLLDVGTGFGFFLAEMKATGWEVAGVELSHKAIDYARDTLGLFLYPGPLEKVGFPEDYFDVVTGFYLIEHLPHPVAFLKECCRILKPGGSLLLRYPHTTPIKNLLHLLGVENRLYDLPAHLSDFSPGMIEQCLNRAGFEGCRHMIGGHTLPKGFGKRAVSSFFGDLSEALFYLSGRRFLLPGVSKTVLAFKRKP